MPRQPLPRTFALLALLSAAPASAGPCDIYGASGTPCAAAHSTVRALYSSYAGRLYQLQRAGDNRTLDIFALAPGGFANSSSHDAFCASDPPTPPTPTPPAPAPGLPAFGTVVRLVPAAAPGAAFSFRHCYSQGFVTATADSGDDHRFTLVPALSGAAGAVSLRSVNYPAQFVAPMPGDAGRAGIVPAPAAADASWAVAPAPGGGFSLTSQGAGGGALALGGGLTGTCAHSYAPPAVDVVVSAGAGAAWAITPDSTGPAYPPRADCVILKVYDQTGNGNHLLPADPAINNPAYDNPVNATRHAILIGGKKVYGMYFESGMGYRAHNTTAVARGNNPETLYMVTSGTHFNDQCCFDYGSSENDADNPSAFCDGCMEAVYFGSGGGWCGQAPPGTPTVLADLENGLWGCDTPNGNNSGLLPLAFDFVTAMVKGGTKSFAIKGGNAGSNGGGALSTMWDGPRPPGYTPMRKTGAIILGVGGDNVWSRRRRAAALPPTIPGTSIGTFYEGVLTNGYTSDAADDAVQADILSAGYGASTQVN